MRRLILIALLASAPWWEIGTARAQQIFIVCHGEFENTCKQHPYTVFERCGSDNGVGGANPERTCAATTGSRPRPRRAAALMVIIADIRGSE